MNRKLLALVITLALTLVLFTANAFAEAEETEPTPEQTELVEPSLEPTPEPEPEPTPEPAPNSPLVTASNNSNSGKIRLTWQPVEGAVKYEVYRANTEDGEYKLFFTTSGGSYTNTGAKAGYTYFYKVFAVSESGLKSESSGIVSRTCDCARPKISAGNDAVSGQPRLTWAAVDGADKYEIWRAASADTAFEKIYTTSKCSYSSTTSKPNNTYYYKIRALSSRTKYAASAYSNTSSAFCKIRTPKVTIDNVYSSGKIILKWSSVSDASKYEVWRAQSKDGKYTRLTTTTHIEYTDNSVKEGSTYYYKVKALYASNDRASSALNSAVSCKCVSAPYFKKGRDGMGPKVIYSGRRDFIWPVPDEINIISCFYDQRNHCAIDIVAERGTRVVCSYPGKVIAAIYGGRSYYGDGFGNYVVIEHNYKTLSGKTVKLYSRYSHLNSVSVSYGDMVSAGQLIGRIGTSGYSTDCHLDFQILNGNFNEYRKYSIDPYANELLELPKGFTAYNVYDARPCGYEYYRLVRELYNKPIPVEAQLSAQFDAQSGKPTLKWNAVYGASKYEVLRADKANGEYKRLYTTVYTSYTDNSAKPNVNYYYKIRTHFYNIDDEPVSDSLKLTCRLPAPKVTASNNPETGKVTLTWAPVEGARAYEVYRARSKNGTYYKMYSTSWASYTNTSSEAGQTYYYKVLALSQASKSADSAYSAIVSRTCDCARPNIEPVYTNGYPRLKWNAVDAKGTVTYTVYRAEGADGEFKKMFSTTATSYTNTSAEPDKSYYYKICAMSENNTYSSSAYSNIINIDT